MIASIDRFQSLNVFRFGKIDRAVASQNSQLARQDAIKGSLSNGLRHGLFVQPSERENLMHKTKICILQDPEAGFIVGKLGEERHVKEVFLLTQQIGAKEQRSRRTENVEPSEERAPTNFLSRNHCARRLQLVPKDFRTIEAICPNNSN